MFTATLASSAVGARSVSADDPATLASYKQVQASYRTVPAVRVHRRRFLWYSVSASGSVVRWVSAKRPPAGQGYKPAAETIVVLLTQGRVTTSVDTAKAAGLPALTILEGSSGLFVKLNARSGACYRASTRAGDVAGWGSQFVGVYGAFAPMQQQGGTVIVRSTYPWLTNGHAAETDHISAATKHLDSYTVNVRGPSPITFSAANQDITAPSPLPAAKPRC